MDLTVEPTGVLIQGDNRYRCALGRAGVTAHKREGDGATPVGAFPLQQVFYRGDRMTAPETGLPATIIPVDGGWCDDPDHADYNQFVRLPHPGRCETLWRDDHLYDLLVVIGHNNMPPVPHLGSAIFIHVAGGNFPATEGCVALELANLRDILQRCTRKSVIRIESR